MLWIAFDLYLWNIEHSCSKLVGLLFRLWIAFDLYLWNIEHSDLLSWLLKQTVVNCFRFVSLKYWTQQRYKLIAMIDSCELLSICIFEILNTALYYNQLTDIGLWIAFDLYLWNIEHSDFANQDYRNHVVNCFRFVSLKYWTQRLTPPSPTWLSCELLSICIFEILNTAISLKR